MILDVTAEFEPGEPVELFRLGTVEAELSDLLGRRVDLNLQDRLDPAFQERVLSEAGVLYDAAWRQRLSRPCAGPREGGACDCCRAYTRGSLRIAGLSACPATLGGNCGRSRIESVAGSSLQIKHPPAEPGALIFVSRSKRPCGTLTRTRIGAIRVSGFLVWQFELLQPTVFLLPLYLLSDQCLVLTYCRH